MGSLLLSPPDAASAVTPDVDGALRLPSEDSAADLASDFLDGLDSPDAAPQFAFGGQTGATGGNSFAANAPVMIGDSIGVGSSCITSTVTTDLTATDSYLVGSPGDTSALIAYSVSPFVGPDFFSVGASTDPDGRVFNVSEPLPGGSAPTSPGPNYVFGGGTATNSEISPDDGDPWSVQYSYDAKLVIPGPGTVVGRQKIAENSSPFPRDRVFYDYSMFDDVPLAEDGITVNRMTPGFELAFLDNNCSFEMRFPFAATLNSSIVSDSGSRAHSSEFGNIETTFKTILAGGNKGVLSGGITVAVPTADDFVIRNMAGDSQLRINNESVYLRPFLGWFCTRQFEAISGIAPLFSAANGSGFFTQGFLQVDVDTSGSSVLYNIDNRGLQRVGVINDTTFLYLDSAIGYLFRFSDRGRGLVGIAPTVELHLTRSLQTSDVVDTAVTMGNQTTEVQVGEAFTDIQIRNLIFGTTFQFARGSQLSVAYGTPIGNDPDKAFDGEFRFIWNQFF